MLEAMLIESPHATPVVGFEYVSQATSRTLKSVPTSEISTATRSVFVTR
jgi:hypothetical protein